MFMRRLRMLLRSGGVLFSLGMIPLAVVLGGGTVCLRCVLVVLCSLVVLVSCHCRFLVVSSQWQPSYSKHKSFRRLGAMGQKFFWLGTQEAVYGPYHQEQPRSPTMSKMPPIPPGNQTTKGPKLDAEAERDTSKGHADIQNSAEQGETANIKQNTTNAGFFKGRRVK